MSLSLNTTTVVFDESMVLVMSSAQIVRFKPKYFLETVNSESVENIQIQEPSEQEFINLTTIELDKIKKEAFDQGYQKAKAEFAVIEKRIKELFDQSKT